MATSKKGYKGFDAGFACRDLQYDEDDDVLYVTFATPKSKVRYVETARGDILRFCSETNQIVGVTILFFAERARRGEAIEIPEDDTARECTDYVANRGLNLKGHLRATPPQL